MEEGWRATVDGRQFAVDSLQGATPLNLDPAIKSQDDMRIPIGPFTTLKQPLIEEKLQQQLFYRQF